MSAGLQTAPQHQQSWPVSYKEEEKEEEDDGKRNEAHERYNFERANFDVLREYFGNIIWCEMTTAGNVN